MGLQPLEAKAFILEAKSMPQAEVQLIKQVMVKVKLFMVVIMVMAMAQFIEEHFHL